MWTFTGSAQFLSDMADENRKIANSFQNTSYVSELSKKFKVMKGR